MNLHNTRRSAGLLVSVLFACGVAACSSAPRSIDPNRDAGEAPILPDATPSVTTTNALVSDCGGFSAPTKGTLSKRIATVGVGGDAGSISCGETLKWSHDEETDRLSLQNLRVPLNCCGEHGITAAYDESANLLVLTETDAPLHGDRCLCQCSFDFAIDVLGLSGPTVDLQLVRNVTDAGGAKTVWSGAVDLTAGTGEIVIGTVSPVGIQCAEH